MLESEYWEEHRRLLEGGQSPQRSMTALLYTHSEPAVWGTGSFIESLMHRKLAVHVALYEPGRVEAVLDVPVVDPDGEVPFDRPITVGVRGCIEVGRPLLIAVGETQLVSSNPPTRPRHFTPKLAK